MTKWFALAASAVLLAGCARDPAAERDNSGQREAEGEILGGSISDAMIPIEQVRSQSRSLRTVPESTQVDDEASENSEGESSATAQEPEVQAAEPADPAN